MNLKTSILILLVLSGLFMIAPTNNNACAGAGGGEGGEGEEGGEIADQTCDTQVWRTMENRARLEMEREMMQNQNLIFKADSILNYTCFDSFVNHAALTIAPIFTHTDYFGGLIIEWGAPNGMDYALTGAIINSMTPYIETNFDHSYLGGRGEFMGLGEPEILGAIPANGGQYECGVMAEVWQVAKCLNFIHTADFATTDGFYPFIDIVALEGEDVVGYANAEINDTRRFPTECTGTPITGSTWEEMYRHSRNETGFGANDYYYQYGTPIRETFAAIRLMVEPAECAAAIPTGVQVILGPNSGDPYADGVCTNPGCSYRRDGECSAEPPEGGEGGEEDGGEEEEGAGGGDAGGGDAGGGDQPPPGPQLEVAD